MIPAGDGLNWNAAAHAFVYGRGLAKSSRETYARTLRTFLDWMQSRGITAPGPETLAAYKAILTGEADEAASRDLVIRPDGETVLEEGLAANTAAKYLTIIRGFFRWLAEKEMMPDITKDLKIGRVSPGYRRGAVPPEKVAAILSGLDQAAAGGSLPALRDRAVGYLLFYGALRAVEVSRGLRKHVTTVNGDKALLVHGKGRAGADEHVFLGPAARPLEEYLAARPGTISPADPLIGKHRGAGVIGIRSVQDLVRKWFRAHGVEAAEGADASWITPHSTRHSSATVAMRNGATLPQVQRHLRHKDVSVTGNYIHLLDRMEDSAVSKIDFSGNV